MINSGNLHFARLSLCYSYTVLSPSVFLQCLNVLHLFSDCWAGTTGQVAHYSWNTSNITTALSQFQLDEIMCYQRNLLDDGINSHFWH